MTQPSPASPIRVELGERSYDINFYQNEPGSMAADIKPFCPEQALVVSNEAIWNMHGVALGDALRGAGIKFSLALIGDGERFKTLESASTLYDQLIGERFGRRGCMIAFGGGVVGDLAGYVAATFLRGVSFIQIPTTVVAMVDSSVGGKTGVDHPLGKNLIGAFHQPRLVAVDTSYLQTLDSHNLVGGFAEVIKYGVISDAAFFEFLEKFLSEAMNLNAASIGHVVRTSCEIKARVVSQDERESGLRAILNYGHTFGHAIESLGEYKEKQFHGQAVAIGMACAADLAVARGMLDSSAAARIKKLIVDAGLPSAVPTELDPEDIWNRMHSDKKVEAGKVRFVLPTAIGAVELVGGIRKEEVIQVLTKRKTG